MLPVILINKNKYNFILRSKLASIKFDFLK